MPGGDRFIGIGDCLMFSTRAGDRFKAHMGLQKVMAVAQEGRVVVVEPWYLGDSSFAANDDARSRSLELFLDYLREGVDFWRVARPPRQEVTNLPG